MQIGLQEILARCHAAIKAAETADDIIVLAGLAGLIQRSEADEQELLENIDASCREHIDSITKAFRHRLTRISEEIEHCQERQKQEERWFALFLDISALFFMGEQGQYAKTIQRICAGIGKNWQQCARLAQDMWQQYPPQPEDLTHRLLLATIQAADPEEEENLPVPWLREAMGEREPVVLPVCSAAASDPLVLYFAEDWQLLFQRSPSKNRFIFEGTQDCQVFWEDKPRRGHVERDRIFWIAASGRWRFCIQQKEYLFVLQEDLQQL